MRVEQPREPTAGLALGVVQRTCDPQVRRRVVDALHGEGVGGDLLERVGEFIGVSGEQRTARVCKQLSAARDRKLDEHREYRREYRENDSDDQENKTELAPSTRSSAP